jgi:hypothetical protein
MPCKPDTTARVTLARRGPFRVEQCPCGTLHLTMGVLTVRLEPLACTELASAMLEAVERLHEQVVSVEPASPTTH